MGNACFLQTRTECGIYNDIYDNAIILRSDGVFLIEECAPERGIAAFKWYEGETGFVIERPIGEDVYIMFEESYNLALGYTVVRVELLSSGETEFL